MGRGEDASSVPVRQRTLDDLKRKFTENSKGDMPEYVEKIEFSEGFLVSFVHQARQGQGYENPTFSREELKRPALLLSFYVDKKDFFSYDETLDLKNDANLSARVALYLSNRLLPLAEGSVRGNVVFGYAKEDSARIDNKVPLQMIREKDDKIIYSLALS
jgi:hypothetical protein